MSTPNASYTDGVVRGFIAGFIITNIIAGLFYATVINYRIKPDCRIKMQKEAVSAGHAHWIVDTNGTVFFNWNTINTNK